VDVIFGFGGGEERPLGTDVVVFFFDLSSGCVETLKSFDRCRVEPWVVSSRDAVNKEVQNPVGAGRLSFWAF
jgi:hypothetical protein